MAEIEIRTDGTLLLIDDPVGQITWLRPFIESEVAGDWYDAPVGCDECPDKEDTILDLQDDVGHLTVERERLKRTITALTRERDTLAQERDVLRASLKRLESCKRRVKL